VGPGKPEGEVLVMKGRAFIQVGSLLLFLVKRVEANL
jgi:hypothetical protein